MDFNNDLGTLSNVAVISPSGTTVTFSGTGGLVPFSGTTAERPLTPTAGTWRYNTTLNKTEYWDGTVWQSGSGVTNLSGLGDVSLSSPVNGNVLQYNGSVWSNSGTSTPSSATGILSTWASVSGAKYYADFAHNLGTNNVVITLYNDLTNELVHADSVQLIDTNTVQVIVSGNTHVLRIVVIANGMYVGGAIAGTGILVDLLANRPTAGTVDRLFLAYDSKVLYRDNGTSWDIMTASSGAVKTMSYFATSVDSPNTADFAINALAPVISDPINTALNVRSFSNTIEQGIAVTLPVPVGAVNVTFNIHGRATTAPTGTAVVQHKVYVRKLPNNAPMGSWSAGSTFAGFTVPLNNYYQNIDQTFTLSSLGMVVGESYQIEITRVIAGVANNLTSAWLLAELSIVFD